MQSLTVKTPAKINLTLDILNKREDNYHEINSIMQAVSLYDEISVSIAETKSKNNIIEISGNSDAIPYDSKNLAFKSAFEFLETNRFFNKKISVYIKKTIPVSAGLAGGSSNAAGVLYALNLLFENICDDLTLSKLASELGSDVNFCLTGGTAFASSRGEKLESLPTPELNIVLIKPKDIAVSAKEAYKKFDLLKCKPEEKTSNQMTDAIRANDTEKIASLLNNNLEASVFAMHPELKQIKDKLIRAGCLNAIMSGSGSSVFGIFKTNPKLKDFVSSKYEIFYVKSVETGINPLL